MARDRAEPHLRSGRISRGATTAGDHHGLCRGVHVADVEAPGEQSFERVYRGGRRTGLIEVAHDRDGERASVESRLRRADHVLGDAAGAALEDVAEPIDQEVVADVAPTAAVRVVRVDAPDDIVGLGLRVRVGPRGVVDEPHVEEVGHEGGAVHEPGVGAPLRSSDDPWTAGQGLRGRWRGRFPEPPTATGPTSRGPVPGPPAVPELLMNRTRTFPTTAPFGTSIENRRHRLRRSRRRWTPGEHSCPQRLRGRVLLPRRSGSSDRARTRRCRWRRQWSRPDSPTGPR